MVGKTGCDSGRKPHGTGGRNHLKENLVQIKIGCQSKQHDRANAAAPGQYRVAELVGNRLLVDKI